MEKKEANEKKSFQTWMRYSAIGSEMVGAVFIGTFGGHQIDKWMQNEVPYATVALLLLGLAAGFYLVYKQIQ